MAEMKQIEHEGIVVESINNLTKVKIVSQSACASCHAKSACTAADLQDKIIDVTTSEYFSKGEHVLIMGTPKQGLIATWLAYVLPVILVLSVLVISFTVTNNEDLSGLLALMILVPYFIIIKLAGSKIKKTFTFTIKSINE